MGKQEITLTSRLQLLRDNDYNYEKVKDTFIPKKGEPILVDTARNGLRAKIGDGKSTYAQLPFVDEDMAKNILVRGYYKDNNFYEDNAFTEHIIPSANKMYYDELTNRLFVSNGVDYVCVSGQVKIDTASDLIAGIMKLYSTTGSNTDGTMTQKAITQELNEKLEAEVLHEEELLVLTTD